MIQVPDGWIVESAIGAVVCANPERTVQVRYRMRLAPLRPVQAIVAEALAAIPEWQTRAIAPRERLVTHEGEHAFAVACEGTWLGAAARRLVGVVYADDHANLLDAITLGAGPPDPRARGLLVGATLHLGARRRRYFYDPPPGWHGHATGLVTHWFPARFPARPATIVAYPASPTHEAPQVVVDAIVAHQQAMGAEPRALASPQPIVARHGLEGVHWQLVCTPPRGPVIHRDLAVFVRRAYTYAVQLDCAHAPDADAHAVFLAMAASIEPVPQGGGDASDGSAHLVFSHYA